MSARQELAGLLEQWHQLSQDEGAAIEAANWAKVAEIQAAKARLQPAITRQKTLFTGANNPFTMQLGRLLSLEARNSELLATQLRRAVTEKAGLDQAQQNLRRLRHSYVQRTGMPALSCYS